MKQTNKQKQRSGIKNKTEKQKSLILKMNLSAQSAPGNKQLSQKKKVYMYLRIKIKSLTEYKNIPATVTISLFGK